MNYRGIAMKVIAMYLPQFHRIPENDRWWGEGFTDWTAVKKAKSLYEDHNQPRIPLNENYYNLLDYDVMLWQANLMKKYEVDGFCMYHYWFKGGNKILEKPAENLLKWKEIPMSFCFCWANETWARSWSNIDNKNTWADIYEKEQNDCGSGILLEQEYGSEEQWVEHFYYLLPFFKDERYIRIDGRPLFLFYKSEDIPCLVEMLDCWRKLCRLCDLPDIYVVGSVNSIQADTCMDAGLYYQPARSRERISTFMEYMKNGVDILEYDDVWNDILAEHTSKKVFFEGIVGYDDTPRRGKKGCIIEHATPDKFSYYLTELLAKSVVYGADIVFLNAWNEWGEGMYLEPDKKFEEKYLSAIPLAKKNFSYRICKYEYMRNSYKETEAEKIDRIRKEAEKDRYYLHILDHWMLQRENGFSVAGWMKKENYRRIAVYGYGILGRHFCKELYDSGIKVEYIIDQRKESLCAEYEVFLPSESLPEVEAVVVTAVYEYSSVYKKLKDRGFDKIFSLEFILNDNQ